MSQLSETFPTLDCSQCILTPRMVESAEHPNIELISYAGLESLEGFVGNFKAKIRKKARVLTKNYAQDADYAQRNVQIKRSRGNSTKDWISVLPYMFLSPRQCQTNR